jgi:hypothetical protein
MKLKEKKIFENKKNYGTTYFYEWIFLFKRTPQEKRSISD